MYNLNLFKYIYIYIIVIIFNYTCAYAQDYTLVYIYIYIYIYRLGLVPMHWTQADSNLKLRSSTYYNYIIPCAIEHPCPKSRPILLWHLINYN